MEKIFLSPLVEIIKRNNKIYICEEENYEIDFDDKVYNAFEMLKNGCYESDVYTYLGEELGKSLLDFLNDVGFIKNGIGNRYKGTIVEKQIDYFFSITSNGNKAQEKLQTKKICIIGVGGIGAVAIQHLVAAGIRSFLLIDGDTVNIDNFNRQMIYRINQLGEKKVYAAKEYIYGINKEASVECIDIFVKSEDDMEILDNKEIDFVICGADKPYNKIQSIVSNYCKKNNIPSIYANVGINIGNWGPLIVPSKDISYGEYIGRLKRKMNEEELIINSVERQPLTASFGITNTLVGAYMTFDVLRFLLGVQQKTGILFAIDFLNNVVYEENINAV